MAMLELDKSDVLITAVNETYISNKPGTEWKCLGVSWKESRNILDRIPERYIKY